MGTINTSEFKKGLKVQLDGDPYLMIECNFVKPGKGQALYKCRLKHLIRGTTIDRTWKSGDSIESVSGTVYNGTPYVAFDDESRDGDPTPEAATVKDWNGSQWVLYAGYPNPCDIEETVLTADPSNGHLYLTYSDCSGDMFVQVH